MQPGEQPVDRGDQRAGGPGRCGRPRRAAAFSTTRSWKAACEPRARPRRAVGALRGERERGARVGEHEGLEVVHGVHELVEARQHLVERARLVHAVDAERRARSGSSPARSPRGRRGRPGRRAARPPRVTSTSSPAPFTIRMPTTCDDRFRKRAPVPCVAVRHGAGERLAVHVTLVLEREPARRQLLAEVVQRDARLHGHVGPRPPPSTRRMRARSTSTPSVQAMSVNEWPEPTARSLARPADHARTAPPRRRGRAIRSGAQRCSPRPVGPGLGHGQL